MKCIFTECNKKANICFQCSYCNNTYCGIHRLPEQHECINLDIKSKLNKQKLEYELIQNKTNYEKIEKIHNAPEKKDDDNISQQQSTHNELLNLFNIYTKKN